MSVTPSTGKFPDFLWGGCVGVGGEKTCDNLQELVARSVQGIKIMSREWLHIWNPLTQWEWGEVLYIGLKQVGQNIW